MFELRFKLVFEVSDVVAAEDILEYCREVPMGICDVYGGREGHHRDCSAGQCGQVFVNYQVVFQPETKPETFGEGEPGSPAKGLCTGLGLSLGVTRGGSLGKTLAESLAQTLAGAYGLARDEVWLGAFSVCNLKDLGGKKGAGFGVGKSVGVPTPGRPTPWVLFSNIHFRRIGKHISEGAEMKGAR